LNETGKYSYNANVVWLLSAKNASELSQDVCALDLEFVKNKLSDFKGIQSLSFFRNQGVLKEASDYEYGPLFTSNNGDIE
jgi:hypothetical protein